MKIQSITLKNIGHFKDLTIPFAPLEEGEPKVTVFIGNNGSGKTNILKSVVTALSWLPARIRTERGQGLGIPEETIHNDKTSASMSVNVLVENDEYTWTLSKSHKGRKNQFATDLKGVNTLADKYRNDLTENLVMDLPLIVFYPVERSVLDIPLKIRTTHPFQQLNAYDNALEMGVDFRRFFEWFREREDIENEEKVSHEINNSVKKIEELSNLVDDWNNTQDEIDNLVDKLHSFSKQLSRGQPDGINDSKAKHKEIDEVLKKIEAKHKEIDEVMQKIDFITDKSKEEKYKYLCSDSALKSVKEAITEFTGFENVWVKRKPKLRMMVSKNNKEFNVFQLSQGEKSLMALVGDVARRLVMLNPDLDNPLEGKGIVIIDEADLHLHPQWQCQLITRLTKTFPNCQFILSTHSPLMISNSKNITVYSLENGEINKVPSQYGQDANTVYLDAMDTAIRNQNVTKQLDNLLDLIQDNKLDEARDKLAQLRAELPENHLELCKAQLFLKKQEIRHAKNQQGE